METLIQEYVDYCRIEKGLAANTLAAYQGDLRRFEGFCAERRVMLLEARSKDLNEFVDSLYRAGLSSRSIARYMASLRNFYVYLMQHGRAHVDPTAELVAPRQWKQLPRFLVLNEVDRLLEAPDTSKPLGGRDRAMLQLLYATGLRVSELVSVKRNHLNMELGVVRATGKGGKQRLVPVGKEALAAVQSYLENDRSRILKGKNSGVLVRHGARKPAYTPGLLEPSPALRPAGRHCPKAESSRRAAQFRDAFARARRGPQELANHVGPRRYFDYADLHARAPRKAAQGVRRASSQELTTSAVEKGW